MSFIIYIAIAIYFLGSVITGLFVYLTKSISDSDTGRSTDTLKRVGTSILSGLAWPVLLLKMAIQK